MRERRPSTCDVRQSCSREPTRRWADQTVNSLEPAWLNLSMNTSTGDGGTCYGDSGGPHFLGAVVVAVTVTGDTQCKATDKDYRVDTPQARAFLANYLTLP
jgi:secreted trypsin-like serine protease